MSTSPHPHSRFLRSGRWSEPFACYAITKTVTGRLPVLAEPGIASILVETMDFERRRDRLRVLAFCIMPDHCHFLVVLLPPIDLSRTLANWFRFATKQINATLDREGPFWREGFYDHRCRNDQEVEDMLIYIEQNPGRAGLVDSAANWPYSSASDIHGNHLDRGWWAEAR